MVNPKGSILCGGDVSSSARFRRDGRPNFTLGWKTQDNPTAAPSRGCSRGMAMICDLWPDRFGSDAEELLSRGQLDAAFPRRARTPLPRKRCFSLALLCQLEWIKGGIPHLGRGTP